MSFKISDRLTQLKRLVTINNHMQMVRHYAIAINIQPFILNAIFKG